MIMQVLSIQMGSNDHLEPFSKQPPCKLHTDDMSLLRRQFSGLKRLDDMIALDPIPLIVAPLGSVHIPAGVFHATAIQAAFKQTLFLSGLTT